MSRPRLHINKSLPPNLYWDIRNQLFRYRRPDKGSVHSMGKDRAAAFTAAKKLNSMLMIGEDLVAKVMGKKKTLKQYIDERFIPYVLPERELAENTQKKYIKMLEIVSEELGNFLIDSIDVLIVNNFLKNYQHAARQSNIFRNLLSLVFTYARAEGLINTNPAKDTIKRKEKKKRQRMSLEQFNAIYESAGKKGWKWLQQAMDIGLITLQRREEVVNMKFTDVITEVIGDKTCELLQVIQQKTKNQGSCAYIKMRIGDELAQVIQNCRNSTVNSPFIIHRKPSQIHKSKNKVHHTQVLPDYLTDKFAEARDATGLFDAFEPLERPTFYEIRSLGIKLYEDSGMDAQKLAGHTNRKMTEAYKKGHEIEWTYANAKGNLRGLTNAK